MQDMPAPHLSPSADTQRHTCIVRNHKSECMSPEVATINTAKAKERSFFPVQKNLYVS